MKAFTPQAFRLFHSILPIVILFSTYKLTLQSIIREFDIKDLEIKEDESRFQADASYWIHSAYDGTNAKPYTFCSQRFLLGGRGVFANNPTTGAYVTRIYTNLPTHNFIYFTGHLWFMKGWDITDTFNIYFDDTLFLQDLGVTGVAANKLKVSTADGVDQCSGTWMADVGLVRVYGGFAHNDTTQLNVTFQGITSKGAWVTTFGLRNLTFSFASAVPTTTIANACSIVSKSTYTVPGSSPATTASYISGQLTVIPAAGTTGVPTVPAIKPACRCSEGMFWDPPNSVAPYYYGACLTCHMSCFSCFGPTAKHCLVCQEGYRFDGNACVSCGSSCTTCLAGAGGIIDTDGACKECTTWEWTYFVPTATGHMFQLQLGPYTCDLDPNGLAKQISGVPSDPEIFPVSNFVVGKLMPNMYFIEITFEKSLVFTTDLDVSMSYLNTTLTIPRKFIMTPSLQNIKDALLPLQIILMVIIGLSLFGTSAIDGTTTLWSFMNLVQFISYLRFLNIEFPKLIEMFFSLGQAGDFSLIPNLFAVMTASASKGIVPSSEDKNLMKDIIPAGVYIHQPEASYFIDNAGALTLATFLILIVALIIVALSSNTGEQSLIMKAIRNAVKWNFILRFYLMTGTPIAIAIFLQLRNFVFDSTYQTVSSVFTILMAIYLIAMFIILIRILQSNENSYLIKGRIRKIFGTLYVGMAIDKSSGKYYHLLVFLRGILIALLVGFVETIPFLQISLLIYYNIGLVYYLFQQAVFTDTKLQAVVRVKELLVLLTEIWILCVNVQVSSTIYYDILQWFIVATLGTALVMELFYLVGQQMVGGGTIVAQIKKLWQFLRVCCKKARDPPQRGRPRHERGGNHNDETAID